MKIIGVTNGGFILRPIANQVRDLILRGLKWSMRETSAPKLGVGVTIRVNEMFGCLHSLRSIENQMEQTKKSIHAIGDLLHIPEPIEEVAATITKLEEDK